MDKMTYKYEISKEKRHENAYIVCLIPIPEFPENKGHLMDIVRHPLTAVIGAIPDGNEGWSFTAFTREEKHLIGDLLIANKANINEWWWCLQYPDTTNEGLNSIRGE